jgi:hypothetical protein
VQCPLHLRGRRDAERFRDGVRWCCPSILRIGGSERPRPVSAAGRRLSVGDPPLRTPEPEACHRQLTWLAAFACLSQDLDALPFRPLPPTQQLVASPSLRIHSDNPSPQCDGSNRRDGHDRPGAVRESATVLFGIAHSYRDVSRHLTRCHRESRAHLGPRLLWLAIIGAYVPQYRRIRAQGTKGISPYYVLNHGLFSTTTLALRLSHSVFFTTFNCVATGELDGWKGYSATLDFLAVFVQWLCAVMLYVPPGAAVGRASSLPMYLAH